MVTRSRSIVTLAAWILLLCLAPRSPVLAQCNTPQSFEGTAFKNDAGFFTPDKIFPYWTFSMVYDSARIIYDIHEMEHNGKKLWLDVWCFGIIHEAEEERLADSSVSAPFIVHAGDTISFYRHLMWTDGPEGVNTGGLYYAKDTLEFAVELLGPDGTRAALMDSIGALREIPAGYMNFYGTADIVDHVRYIVPQALDNQMVRMRVRPYARGEGLYQFLRYDGFMLGRMSVSLTNPDFIRYRDQINDGTAKQTVLLEDLYHLERWTSGALTADYSRGAREIVIEYKGIEADGTCSFRLYNIDGTVSEQLLDVHPMSEAVTLRYTPPSSGAYVAAVYSHDILLASTKILVQQ